VKKKVDIMEIRVICGVIIMAIVFGIAVFFDVDSSEKTKIRIRRKI
jgi:hypothetical protein